MKTKTLFWTSVFLTFLVVHTPLPILHHLLTASSLVSTDCATWCAGNWDTLVARIVLPLRAVLFYFGVSILLFFAFRSSGSFLKQCREEHHLGLLFGESLLILVFLALLIVPAGPGGMGEWYAEMSRSPFSQSTGWYYKRLLTPALSYLLLLRGHWLYFVFSLLNSALFVTLCNLWFRRNGVPLKHWQLLSIVTASFAAHQLQMPCYPDALLFNLILIGALLPMDTRGKLSILVLCLLTHESSAFVLLPIALFRLPWRGFVQFAAILALYGLLWLGSYGFNPSLSLGAHHVDGIPGWMWLKQRPHFELAGIFYSYKLLWLPILAALALLCRRRQWRTAAEITLILAGATAMTVVGLDTSRLLGFGFLALFLALRTLQREPWLQGTAGKWAWNAVLAANLLIPTIYVGLNTGPMAFPGVYGALARWLWVGG